MSPWGASLSPAQGLWKADLRLERWLTVKSARGSCRGPEFGLQDPHGRLTTSVTPRGSTGSDALS